MYINNNSCFIKNRFLKNSSFCLRGGGVIKKGHVVFGGWGFKMFTFVYQGLQGEEGGLNNRKKWIHGRFMYVPVCALVRPQMVISTFFS